MLDDMDFCCQFTSSLFQCYDDIFNVREKLFSFFSFSFLNTTLLQMSTSSKIIWPKWKKIEKVKGF